MKALVCRLLFVLPVLAFGVYVLLIIFGIVSSSLGAGTGFYCTVYCKVGVGLIALALGLGLFTQIRACLRDAKSNRPEIPV